MNLFNRILILSPHTDDGEISCGGTIAKMMEKENEVIYVAFSSCEKSIPECFPNNTLKIECNSALAELGLNKEKIILLNYEVREFNVHRQEILDKMLELERRYNPTLVICPSSFDVHQDHQVIYQESVRAFKKTCSIWGMEHPWNNLIFRTDIFIELEEKNIEKKLLALKKYESQVGREYFNEEFIRSWAISRGMNIRKPFAEVFECIRIRI